MSKRPEVIIENSTVCIDVQIARNILEELTNTRDVLTSPTWNADGYYKLSGLIDALKRVLNE